MSRYEDEMKRVEETKKRLRTYKMYKEIEKFWELQQKHAETGANDSEPGWTFKDCLRRTLVGRKAKVPTTANGWELFTCDKKLKAKCRIAAKELTAQARKVIGAKVTLVEAREIREWFGWDAE